jgi:cytoskeleton protein RodZ
MSSTLFGEHLKREREMRGVSLEEISAATRISTRFLEAMENDRWDQLPGGVFNRGFIRSIARYLGLDEDSLVAEYSLGTVATDAARAAAQRTADIPRNWRGAVGTVLIAILVIVGGGFAGYHYRGWIANRLHRHGSGVSTGTSGPVSTPTSADGSSSGASGAPASGDQSTIPVSEVLALKIQVAKSASVKVVADGNILFDGPLQANDVKQFEAHDTFDITASDSSAVTLELNGQSVSLNGAPGQPGNATLTRNDLKAAAGGSN